MNKELLNNNPFDIAADLLHRQVVIEDTTTPAPSVIGEVTGISTQGSTIIATVETLDGQLMQVNTGKTREVIPYVFTDRGRTKLFHMLPRKENYVQAYYQNLGRLEDEGMVTG